MSKVKAKTLSERMGFRDPDLSTPEHDEMILALMKKTPEEWVEIADCVLKQFHKRTLIQQRKSEIEQSIAELKHSLDKAYAESDKIRYTDDINSLVTALKNNNPKPSADIRVEVPIQKGEGKYATVVGFADIAVEIGLHGWCTTYLMCEVKPQIESFGGVLRQMNFYAEYGYETIDKTFDGYTRSPFFLVITKTPDLKQAFVSQSIGYISWDSLPKRKKLRRSRKKKGLTTR